MKRISALILALILAACGMASAFAEEESAGQQPREDGGFADGMTPPEPPKDGKPGGPGGTPPDGKPGGTPPDGAPGSGGFGGGTPPGGRTSSFEYAAAAEITEAAESAGQVYASETADESALIVNTADAVTITDPTVTKTGDSGGGDNCNFYGLNAGVLVMGGSTVTISGGTVETSASGANGVFSYGGNGGPERCGRRRNDRCDLRYGHHDDRRRIRRHHDHRRRNDPGLRPDRKHLRTFLRGHPHRPRRRNRRR